MKTVILTCFFLLALFTKIKTTTVSIDDVCNLFAKNGRPIDTVVVKASFLEAEMTPQGQAGIVYLEKKGRLKLRHHYYSIKIATVGCKTGQWLLCGDNDKSRVSTPGNEDTPTNVTLTCVVFRDPEIPNSNGGPFVVVMKIRKQ